MIVTKIYCDKCKKEINESTTFQGKDLCDCCRDKAVSMILAWIDKVEDPEAMKEKKVQKECKKEALTKKIAPKKREEQQAVKIDWDKACALKVAGWKNSAIADEMGVEQKTIDSGTFYKKLTQYKIERGIE